MGRKQDEEQTIEQRMRKQLYEFAFRRRAEIYRDSESFTHLRGRLSVWYRRAVKFTPRQELLPLSLIRPFRTPKLQEVPTPERLQHGDITWDVVDRDSVGNPLSIRARDATPLVLDWYRKKGTIDWQQCRAGYIFALLYFTAGKVPRVNVMFQERIQKSLRPSDFAAWINDYTQAQKDLNAAMDILNPVEIDVMREVAGLNVRAGTPQRVRALQSGLRALAVHFGVPVQPTPKRRQKINA